MLKKDIIELIKKKYPNKKNLSKLLKKDLIKLLETNYSNDNNDNDNNDNDYNLNNDNIKEYIKNCDISIRKSLEKIFENTIYISFNLLISYINEILNDFCNKLIKNKLKRPIFIYKPKYNIEQYDIWIIDYIIEYINIKYKTIKIYTFNDIDLNDKRFIADDIIIFSNFFIPKNKVFFYYNGNVNTSNIKLQLNILIPVITNKIRYDIFKAFYSNNKLNKCTLNINEICINNIKIISDILDDNEISLIDNYYNIILQTSNTTIKNKYLIYFDNCIDNDYTNHYFLTPIYTGLILNEDNMKILKKNYKTLNEYNKILKTVKYINIINNYNEKYNIIYTLPPIDINKINFKKYIKKFKEDKTIKFTSFNDIINISYSNKYKKNNKKVLNFPKLYEIEHNLNKNNIIEYIKKSDKSLDKIIEKIYKYTEYISYDLFTSILNNLIDDSIKYLQTNIIYLFNNDKEESKTSIKYIITYINYYYPNLQIEIITNSLNYSKLKDNDIIILCNDYLISGIPIVNILYDVNNINKLKLNFYIISSCYTHKAKASIFSAFYSNNSFSNCNIIFNNKLMKFINEINYYLTNEELDIIDKYYYNLLEITVYRKHLILFQHILLNPIDTITSFYYGFLLNNYNYKLINQPKKYVNYEESFNYVIRKLKYINIINNIDEHKFLINPNKLDYNTFNNVLLLNN